MFAILRDLRLAWRTLWRSRGYAVAATVMITLGVTAGAVLFTIYKGALLDPWPYEGGERLLVFRADYPAIDRDDYPLWSAADFAEVGAFDEVFEHVVAGRGRDANLEGANGAERVLGAEMTPNAFAMLGIRPLHGRVLDEADARPGAEKVVVIGHALWQRRFGGEADAVGRTLPIDGEQYEIVGVMPPRFQWWGSQIWLPLRPDVASARDERRYVIQARLREGVGIDRANAVLATWARNVEQAHASAYPEYRNWNARTSLLVDAVVRDVREVLGILLAAVGLLVLVAAFNVANLLLARAAARRREFAVRSALGASPARMARGLLAENILLAAIGGGLGLLLAVPGVRLITALIPYGYLPAEANIAIDLRVGLLAAGIALLVAVLAVVPATGSLRRMRVAAALHEARGTGSKTAIRLRSLFVIAQLALATVVVAAALAVGSGFRDRLSTHPGFDPENLLSLRVSLPRDGYPDRADLRRFLLALQVDLDSNPRIAAAGIGTTPPLADGPMYPLSVQGSASLTAASRYEIVAGDWFAALRVPVLRGRAFDERDRAGSRQVAIVNETFARRFLDGRDPLGAQVRASPDGDAREWLTVVGVVGDMRVGGVDGEVRPLVYQPLAQATRQPRSAVVLLRGAVPAAALAREVRRTVAAMDPAVPVHAVERVEDIVLASMGGQRLAAWLLGGFAVTVLLLAVLGVYGIVSYVTRLSGAEFGVRMALGATGTDIVRLVGKRGMALSAIGIGAGLVLAAGALRVVAATLEQALPAAIPVLAFTAMLLATMVFLACSAPAIRGGRTDPAVALRDE